MESGKFLLVESGILSFGIRPIQLKDPRIPLTIGIQNLSFAYQDWNPLTGIWNPGCGIQNPRLS